MCVGGNGWNQNVYCPIVILDKSAGGKKKTGIKKAGTVFLQAPIEQQDYIRGSLPQHSESSAECVHTERVM